MGRAAVPAAAMDAQKTNLVDVPRFPSWGLGTRSKAGGGCAGAVPKLELGNQVKIAFLRVNKRLRGEWAAVPAAAKRLGGTRTAKS